MSKPPANHEPTPEFVLFRLAVVVGVAVLSTFAPLSYPLHFLDGYDASLAFYEDFRQLGSGTIPIEGPDVAGACP